MTYLFQSLDRTAVDERRGVKQNRKPLAPIVNNQRVPEHQACVANKLRECQALGPRVALLERQLAAPKVESQARKMNIPQMETRGEISQKIRDARTNELKNKQQLVDKQKKEKELSRIRQGILDEEKRQKIIQEKQTSDVAQLKEKRAKEYFQKQEAVREFRQRQMQKMADVKAIKDYQSRKIVQEKKQQKEYEQLLEQELEEELVQLKQKEKELQFRLKFGGGGDNYDYDSMMDNTTATQSQAVTHSAPKKQQSDKPKTRSCDILRAQMIQERMK